MNRTSNFFHILLLICSVFGADADKVKAVSVFEGESVTLNPDKDLQAIFLVLWRFGDKGSTIAQFIDKEISYPNHTGIFRERLKLNETGSLAISNMRAKHSGHYDLQIDGREHLKMKFIVTVNEPPLVIGDYKTEIKSVSVKEGYHVSLFTDVNELHGDELIVWRFGDEEKLLAKDDKETKSTRFYDTDERFRHRLELNDQTGSLTIKHTKDTDAGLYTVTINSNKNTIYKKFIVTVSGSGLSSGAVAGIVVLLLLLFPVAAVLVFFYYRNKISELQKRLGSVYETAVGDDVTIKPETELHPGDEIQWWFWNELSPIAGIKDGKIFTSNNPKWKGRDRLKLDKKTGSLTINNIGRKLTGNYTLEIIRSSGKNIRRTFTVLTTENKIAAQKGASQTLKPDTEIQRDDEIQWLFGNKNDLVAKMTGVTRKIIYPDERFKDRLNLNKKTGSLTINNITFKHTGVFKVKISSWRRNKIQVFIVYIPLEDKIFTEGDTAVLQSGAEIQIEDEVEWRFKGFKSPIAKIKDGQKDFPSAGPGERFKETLDLDEKTGSLIIKNGRPAHSGRYCLQIKNSTGAPVRAFNVVFRSPAENQEPALLPEEQKLLSTDFEDILYANERTSPV